MWAPWQCVQVFSYLWSASTAHNVGATGLCTGIFLPVVSLHCPQRGRHSTVYRCFLTCGMATSSASSFIRWHSHLTITSARSTANLRCSTVACHSHVTSCSCNSKLCHTAQGKQHLTMWFVIVAMTVLYTHPFKGPFPGLPR